MASSSRDKDGSKRVQFIDRDGKRRTVRLGVDVPQKAVDDVCRRVAALNAAAITGTPIDGELARWVRNLPDAMHDKLARVGLVPSREQTAATLAQLVERFEAAAVVKASTKAAYKQTTGSLLESLGETTPVRSITAADADRWVAGLADEGLSPATRAKRTIVARAIFRRAVRWGLIESSPFEHLKAGSQSNPARQHYIPRAALDSILAACPSVRWRAIVGLARLAALRTPSEPASLRWSDVDWERGRLTVRSPKQERHGEHAERVVPIDPALGVILAALFTEAKPGADLIFPELGTSANLRTTFQKIIRRAGLSPWPRTFHNLRASALADWCERFPSHAVARWAGHSPMIAARHYVGARDVHFDRAAGRPVAESGAHPSQNPAQPVPAPTCPERTQPAQVLDSGGFGHPESPAGICGQDGGMGVTGLEPVTSRV
jgi:integrase